MHAKEAGAQTLGKRHHGAAVTRCHRSRLVNVLKGDLQSDWFSYAVDEAALAQGQMMDGEMMLVTNVSGLTPAEVVERYRELSEIEGGFRVLKIDI